MNITVQLRLFPSAEQADRFRDTMRRFNAACNAVAEVAFREQTANKFRLQKLVYEHLRTKHGIPADMAIRVIAQVCEAYKRDRSRKPAFRPLAAVPYSHGKNYSYKGIDRVSVQVCPSGRQIVPFVMGEYQRKQFAFAKGQADLVHRDGKWFLYVTVDVPEPDLPAVSEFLGVDLGIVNLATDSTGERFTGADVERHRKRHLKARRSFQRRGTRSAKRRLKKLSGKQSRYQKAVNHRISKAVVAKAKALGTGIAIEDLKGLRTRCEKTVRRRQRSRLSNWSFFQLRAFLSYKAKLAGVPVIAVDPRNTSRTCFACGHCDKGNRKSQDRFSCLACGHTACADCNAASNIAARAAQSTGLIQSPGVLPLSDKPPASVGGR